MGRAQGTVAPRQPRLDDITEAVERLIGRAAEAQSRLYSLVHRLLGESTAEGESTVEDAVDPHPVPDAGALGLLEVRLTNLRDTMVRAERYLAELEKL